MLIGHHICKIERILSKILPIATVKCRNCIAFETQEKIVEDKIFGGDPEIKKVDICTRFNKKAKDWQYCDYFDKKDVITPEDKTYCINCQNLGKFVEEKRTPDSVERDVKYRCLLGHSALIPEKMHDGNWDKFDITHSYLKFKGCKGYETSFYRRLVNKYLVWRN